jgi:hypothetical protein
MAVAVLAIVGYIKVMTIVAVVGGLGLGLLYYLRSSGRSSES